MFPWSNTEISSRTMELGAFDGLVPDSLVVSKDVQHSTMVAQERDTQDSKMNKKLANGGTARQSDKHKTLGQHKNQKRGGLSFKRRAQIPAPMMRCLQLGVRTWGNLKFRIPGPR